MSDANQFADDKPVWEQPHNPWIIALVVTMATFMEVLDTSVANVALPHIAGNLAASQDESTWVLTSYLVSNAVVLPLSGWISERVGRKRFYMSCVALFTISSLLCGLAPSLSWLVFFRVLQGAGGGGLQPSEQAILADTFPPARRGMAFAVYGMAVVAAPALGPTLGGWITDNYTWRWIFFINVPVGILSLTLTSWLISDPPYMKNKKSTGAKIDYIGFGLIAVGLGFLQVVLDKGQRADWFETTYIRVFTCIFVTALILAVIWELRVKYPIVELRLFKDRTFLMGNVMLFALGFTLYSSTVLLPQFTQELLGYTAQQAGMMISPGGVAIMLLMPLVGYLVSHYDARKIIAFGFLVIGLATLNMLRFNLQIDFGTMMWARVLQAAGVAFLFVPINTAAYTYLPREKSNAASGLINLSRNIGASVGISFVTTMLARRAQFHQSVLVAHLSPYDAHFMNTVRALGHGFASSGAGAVTATRQAYGVIGGMVAQQSALLAYIDNFWVLGVSALVFVPLTFLMKKSKPGGPIAVHYMIRIIAIEREFGCGESALVETLAARLGWKLLDQSLTEEVARIAQVARTVVEQREGRLDPLFYRLAKVFWHGCYEKGIPVRGQEAFDADRALALVQQVVNQAATEGNCVIVGRGSAYFLRERTDTFRVFLFAPREFKFRFLSGRTENEAKANELLDTVDYNRKMFVKHYFGLEWPLRSAYHAMLNAALGDDLILATILNLMDALNKQEAST